MFGLHSMRRLCCLLIIVCTSSWALDWPDPVANDVIPYGVSGLTHGPVLGAPTSQSMRVWVRTKEPGAFCVVYNQALPLNSDCPAVTGMTASENDNTGWVDIENLKANTVYYYGVMMDGALIDTRLDFQDPWPCFKTLPDVQTCKDPKNNPRGLFNLCFSVGGDASQQAQSAWEYKDHRSFSNLLKLQGDEIMFMLFKGDVIYEEGRDGTLDGLRNNYKSYWTYGRSFSRLRRYIPMLYDYDDHELGQNMFGSGFPGYTSTKGHPLMRDIGLKAWTEYCDWANFHASRKGTLRFGKAQLQKGSDVLYDPEADFSTLDPKTVSTIHLGIYTKGGDEPVRPQNAGVYGLVEVIDSHHLRLTPACIADEKDVLYSIGTHFYYDWKIANCHFFFLDTRGERGPFDKNHPDDPDTYILGPRQRQWLLDGVRSSDADFIFILSPDPWVVHHTAFHVLLQKEPQLLDNPPEKYTRPKGDGFSSYLHERKILIDALDQINKPVIVFTGDTHNSMAVRITDNLWEFLAGPLGSARHPIATCGNMPLGGRWNSRGRDVTIEWAAASPNNLFYKHNRNTFYVVVQVNNVMKTGSPETPGCQWFAYDRPNVVIGFHDGYTGKLVYAQSISLADF